MKGDKKKKKKKKFFFFFFSSRRRHTRSLCDWSSDVCSSDLLLASVIKSLSESKGDLVMEVGLV